MMRWSISRNSIDEISTDFSYKDLFEVRLKNTLDRDDHTGPILSCGSGQRSSQHRLVRPHWDNATKATNRPTVSARLTQISGQDIVALLVIRY